MRRRPRLAAPRAGGRRRRGRAPHEGREALHESAAPLQGEHRGDDVGRQAGQRRVDPLTGADAEVARRVGRELHADHLRHDGCRQRVLVPRREHGDEGSGVAGRGRRKRLVEELSGPAVVALVGAAASLVGERQRVGAGAGNGDRKTPGRTGWSGSALPPPRLRAVGVDDGYLVELEEQQPVPGAARQGQASTPSAPTRRLPMSVASGPVDAEPESAPMDSSTSKRARRVAPTETNTWARSMCNGSGAP